jgi:hypothetical protein
MRRTIKLWEVFVIRFEEALERHRLGRLPCAEQHAGEYLILRVGNVRGRPVCCEIRDLGAELDFRAVTFECTFKPIAESPGSEGADPAVRI